MNANWICEMNIHCNIIQTKIKTGSDLKVQTKHDKSTVNVMLWNWTMIFYESGNAHPSILRTKVFSNHSKTSLLSELILTTRVGRCISLISSLRQIDLWVQGQSCVIEFQVNSLVRPCPKINRYRQIKITKVVILYYYNI